MSCGTDRSVGNPALNPRRDPSRATRRLAAGKQ
jgi:hypothetical protein